MLYILLILILRVFFIRAPPFSYMLYQFHKSTSVDETNCFKSIMSFLGKSSMRCARKKTYRKIWGIARPLMQNRFLICKSFILSAECPSPIIPIRQIRKFCRKTLSLYNRPHSRIFYFFLTQQFRQSRLFCHWLFWLKCWNDKC